MTKKAKPDAGTNEKEDTGASFLGLGEFLMKEGLTIDSPIGKSTFDEEQLLVKRLEDIASVVPNMNIYAHGFSAAIRLALEYDMGYMLALARERASDKTGVVEWESKDWIDAIQRRLSRLVFVDALIHSSGLLAFRDQLMTKFINSMFNESTPKKPATKD
jgi:hypothetical protein